MHNYPSSVSQTCCSFVPPRSPCSDIHHLTGSSRPHSRWGHTHTAYARDVPIKESYPLNALDRWAEGRCALSFSLSLSLSKLLRQGQVNVIVSLTTASVSACSHIADGRLLQWQLRKQPVVLLKDTTIRMGTCAPHLFQTASLKATCVTSVVSKSVWSPS